jgi:hypothetical protein
VALAASLGGVGCKHLPGGHGIPGGGGGGVDPNSCGNYASMSDAGRKLKAFLEASATLQTKSAEMVVQVKAGCDAMGKELGFGDADLKGDPKAVCDKVIAKLEDDMKVGVKAKAAFKIDAKPAVCKVDVEASASAAASCEGSASANVQASCSGHCGGKCDGTCEGGTNSGGSCSGTCKGKCEADCQGAADVNASAQCKASAEVHANADVSCTPPELTVTLDASMTVDKPKADQALNALKNGLPKILEVKAKLVPMQFALKGYLTAASDLAKEGSSLAKSFKDQALCISGQIAAVAQASTQIQANVNVSVSVSASASASTGG